jgi:hypothetical protein
MIEIPYNLCMHRQSRRTQDKTHMQLLASPQGYLSIRLGVPGQDRVDFPGERNMEKVALSDT